MIQSGRATGSRETTRCVGEIGREEIAVVAVPRTRRGRFSQELDLDKIPLRSHRGASRWRGQRAGYPYHAPSAAVQVGAGTR